MRARVHNIYIYIQLYRMLSGALRSVVSWTRLCYARAGGNRWRGGGGLSGGVEGSGHMVNVKRLIYEVDGKIRVRHITHLRAGRTRRLQDYMRLRVYLRMIRCWEEVDGRTLSALRGS